jgi:ribose 5-phosphate isomerase A
MMMTDSNTMKQTCAREALKIIPNHSVIGLGGGSTIGYLIDFLKRAGDFDVKVVTPSAATKRLCCKSGLRVVPTEMVNHVDIAFDGCDQVDEQLRALKSRGGIHTREKLIASMADDYILLVDESKVVKKLTFDLPVVLELLQDAAAYVKTKVSELGGKPVLRQSDAKDGFTISDNGHLLMDVFFSAVDDIEELNAHLKAISGVMDTSLFTGVVTKVLIANRDGMRWMKRKSERGE